MVDFVCKLRWRFALIGRTVASDPCRFGQLRSSRWPPTGLLPIRIWKLSCVLLSSARSLLSAPHRCSSTTNLSEIERAILEFLQADRSLVVRPANKDNRWVLFDRTQCSEECRRLLSDAAAYTPVPRPLSPLSWSGLSSVLLSLRSKVAITGKELTFLKPSANPRPLRYGILFKLQKDSRTTLSAPPGRSIMSDVRTDIRGVARFTEFFLSPITRR